MEGGTLFNPGFLGAAFLWWVGQIADDSTWRDNINAGNYEDAEGAQEDPERRPTGPVTIVYRAPHACRVRGRAQRWNHDAKANREWYHHAEKWNRVEHSGQLLCLCRSSVAPDEPLDGFLAGTSRSQRVGGAGATGAANRACARAAGGRRRREYCRS